MKTLRIILLFVILASVAGLGFYGGLSLSAWQRDFVNPTPTPLPISDEAFRSWPSVLAEDAINRNSASDEQKKPLSTSVHKFIPNATLPSQVQASNGQLTLFADFNDRHDDFIVLYLVNRREKEITLSTQDNDLYVKLHAKLPSGEWQKAQGHVSSWCGNSYYSVTLPPGFHYRFLGYSPRQGRDSIVRFELSNGSQNATIISNEGPGKVLDADIKAAQTNSQKRESIRKGYVPEWPSPLDADQKWRRDIESFIASAELTRHFYNDPESLKSARAWLEQAQLRPFDFLLQEPKKAITQLINSPAVKSPSSTTYLQRCLEALRYQGNAHYGSPNGNKTATWKAISLCSRLYHPEVPQSLWTQLVHEAVRGLSSNLEEEIIASSQFLFSPSIPEEFLTDTDLLLFFQHPTFEVSRAAAQALVRRSRREDLAKLALQHPIQAQHIAINALQNPGTPANEDGFRFWSDICGPSELKLWGQCFRDNPSSTLHSLLTLLPEQSWCSEPPESLSFDIMGWLRNVQKSRLIEHRRTREGRQIELDIANGLKIVSRCQESSQTFFLTEYLNTELTKWNEAKEQPSKNEPIDKLVLTTLIQALSQRGVLMKPVGL